MGAVDRREPFGDGRQPLLDLYCTSVQLPEPPRDRSRIATLAQRRDQLASLATDALELHLQRPLLALQLRLLPLAVVGDGLQSVAQQRRVAPHRADSVDHEGFQLRG